MYQASLTDEVREIMATTFDVDEDELPDDVTQAMYPPWSSLQHLTLMLALEERYGVSFSTEEMPEMTSLPLIVSALRRHGVGLDS